MKSYNKFFCVCLLIAVNYLSLNAQIQLSNLSIEEYIGDILEQYTTETEIELDAGLFYEELMTLYYQPVNLNIASRLELQKMMFLSESKIENILYYVYKFGPLKSIYELQLVEGLDMTDIKYMLPFVVVGDAVVKKQTIKFADVFNYGKNEVLGSFTKGIENKAAYLASETDSSKYKGSSLYHYFKYKYHYNDRVLLSITAEKDAGEKFFKGTRSGYDFYSGSIQLKDIGFAKNIIVGDYQIGFGQGLVIKQSFTLGKSSMTTQVLSNTNGFRRYSSTNEYNYSRGIAISFQHQNIDYHLFYSNKSIDGKLQDNTFSGFYNLGYHRTIDEFQKKNTIQQLLYGGNVTLTGKVFQIGLTSLLMQLNHNLIPREYPYNIFNFHGNQQIVTGMNYRVKWLKFNFFGEVAIIDKATATINGCTYSPIQRVNIAIVQRYYAPEYNAVFATAFSDGSNTSNEQGFYVGVEMTPFKNWKWVAYADSYHFPWLKYTIDSPSVGNDVLFQANYTPTQHTTMFWRFKVDHNEKNIVASISTVPALEKYCKSSLRYQLVHSFGSLKFKNLLEGNLVSVGDESITYGFMAMQEISFSCKKIPLIIDVRYLLFDVINYDNRIYAYEKDILYAFSIPMFSGLGSRYYINLRYEISKNFSCWMKYSQNIYADGRESIGIGNELIIGNKRTEVKCLFQWKF